VQVHAVHQVQGIADIITGVLEFQYIHDAAFLVAKLAG